MRWRLRFLAPYVFDPDPKQPARESQTEFQSDPGFLPIGLSHLKSILKRYGLNADSKKLTEKPTALESTLATNLGEESIQDSQACARTKSRGPASGTD